MDIEANEMNPMIDDIERVLNNISHQLKQVIKYILLNLSY
jgi:hypothetical protein